MKKLHLAPIIAMFLLSCMTHEKTAGLEGVFTGEFSYGNFTDNISFEIKNDSANWEVLFSSLEQNAINIPAKNVLVRGDSINFMLQSDKYTYDFINIRDRKEDVLVGTLRVDTMTVDYTLNRQIPSDSKGTQPKEVKFQSNGLQFAGTIWEPGIPNQKAIVFVTSSGGGDRSGSRAEAMYFAQKGYTTFHYDKRGTGASEGDWQKATMEELCADDINAIQFFIKETGIPPGQIGIKGSSQGATKVPYILNKQPELNYGIVVSCPASSLLESDLNFWKNQNADILGENLEPASQFQKKVFEHIAGKISRDQLQKAIEENNSEPWFSAIWIPDLNSVTTDTKLLYSPMSEFEKLQHPVLVIQGSKDEIIPPESHKAISQALEKAKNEDFKTVVLKNANHSMYQTANTDFPYWAKLHDDYLRTIAGWIEE